MPIPVAAGTAQVEVNLCWNVAESAGKRTFALQCRSDPAAPTFGWASDCAPLSEITWNPTAEAVALRSFSVFVGQEPSGDAGWGCFPVGVIPPAGITASPQCYVRFTTDSESNNSGALSSPITFAPD
jgi:hypothetical protein